MYKNKEKELATHITDELNGLFNNKEFCEAMSREHRFLQYEFTNLCLDWLNKCREMYEAGRYDGRNELACKTGKILMDYLDKRNRSIVTKAKFAKAKQCLIDNGIEQDEADVVLQALCYILCDEETEKYF